jgi:PAS domain S-box-containing protein
MRTELKIILVSLCFGALFWIAHGLLDYLLFYKGNLIDSLLFQTTMHEVTVRITGFLLFTGFGLVMAWVVNKYKKVQVALQESEQKYRLITDNTADVIAILDTNWQITYINPAVEQYTGYSPAEAMEMTIGNVLLPEALKETEADQLRLQEQNPGEGFFVERELIYKDGSTIWSENFVAPLRDEAGDIDGYLTVTRDITKRRQTEAALRESEKRFRAVLERLPIVAVTLDNTGTVIFCNEFLLKLSGWQKADVVGQNWFDLFIPPDSTSQVENIFTQTITTGDFPAHYENDIITKCGQRRTVAWHNTVYHAPDGRVISVTSVGEDITARKQTEQALQRERDRAQLYLDIAGVMLVALDGHGNISLVNQQGCRVLGYTEDELLGMNWFSTCLPAIVREPVEQVYHHLMRGEIEVVEYFVNPVITSEGEERLVAWHNTVLRDEQGEITGILSSGTDVTEQTLAEQALRESENRHRIISELTSDYIYSAIVHSNGQTETEWISGAFTRITGYEANEIVGRPDIWGSHVLAIDQAALDAHIEKLMAGNASVLEYRITAKDGTEHWLRDHVKPLWSNEEQRVIKITGAVKDITQEKTAESRLRDSLAEKEILLKEIHHRVKNNLQIISSLLALQANKVEDERTTQALDDSRSRVRSMALVHETLYQSPDLGHVDAKAYLEKVARQLFSIYHSKLDIAALKLDVAPIHLSLDTAIPCGIITNELVSNALKHAFPPTLADRSGWIKMSLTEIEYNRFRLSVVDNGIGLPAEFNLDTTDSLGMQLIQILTDQLGGQLETVSDKGTAFHITFQRQ